MYKKAVLLLLCLTPVSLAAQSERGEMLSFVSVKDAYPDDYVWYNDADMLASSYYFKFLPKSSDIDANLNNIFDSSQIIIIAENHSYPAPFHKVIDAVISYNKKQEHKTASTGGRIYEGGKIKALTIEQRRDFWSGYLKKYSSASGKADCDKAVKAFYNDGHGKYRAILLDSICKLHNAGVKTYLADLEERMVKCKGCAGFDYYIKGTDISVVSDKGIALRNLHAANTAADIFSKEGKTLMLVGMTHLETAGDYLGIPDLLRKKMPGVRISSVVAVGGEKYSYPGRIPPCACSMSDREDRMLTIIRKTALKEDSDKSYIIELHKGYEGSSPASAPADYLLHYSSGEQARQDIPAQ
ncbi:hypothetical protein Dip518_000696 [Parelusimicrobium proximum]|uniref:hypothetical protein n=1 Tax=Parelusimicrobium proximum TaxID=3228953 RepID=UPI003D174657